MAVEQVTGATPAWFVEYDAAPSKILAHHWPDVPNYGDVTKVDWETMPPVDILTGGYPCQPFSQAGKRKGTNDDRHLWPYVREAIRHLRPRLTILENVAGHRSLGFDRVLGDMAEDGLHVRWASLRASEIGAPHHRERLFIVASLDGLFDAGHDAGRAEQWLEHAVASPGVGESGKGATDPGHEPGRRGPLTTAERRAQGRTASVFNAVMEMGPAAEKQVKTLLPTPVAQPSGNTPEDHLRKKPGRETVTDLAIIVENDLLKSGGKLLPTPRTTDATNSMTAPSAMKHVADGFGALPEVIGAKLMPTPAASDSKRDDNPSQALRKSPGLTTVSAHFPPKGTPVLPTPTASEGGANRSASPNAARRPTLTQMGREPGALNPDAPVMPTPTASDATGGGAAPEQEGRAHAPTDRHRSGIDFGPYTPAVRHWERVTRPAPAPTELNTKGNPRLNAGFAEWMMGLPAGHVTQVPGISRADQLKAIGNGVCPQQAAAAIHQLLTSPAPAGHFS